MKHDAEVSLLGMDAPLRAVLAGFPTDANSSFERGAAKAPSPIRKAMWSEAGNPYAENGLRLARGSSVIDAGDAPLRNDADESAVIGAFVAELLEKGSRIVSLGGDHSITFPIVRAYALKYPQISIVHFDAHPDLYPSFDGNPYSHASPFARILESVDVAALVQIGIRTMSPPQREVVERYGVAVFGPDDVAGAIAALPGGPVYVTIDLDGLDPAFAPGVSHREPGGLSVRDVLRTIVAIPGQVVGGDVVEYNPDRDVDGLTAQVGAKLARELLARILADATTYSSGSQ